MQIYLKAEFDRRKKSNDSYSLRAFARDLAVDSSLLSKILQGKRYAGRRVRLQIEENLKLIPGTLESGALQLSTQELSESQDDQPLKGDEFFNVISQWEHFALLNLLVCPGFKHSAESAASLLDVSLERAKLVIHELKVVGLLVEEYLPGKKDVFWRRGKSHIKTTDGERSLALRTSHLESLELAKNKLLDLPIEDTNYSAIIFPVDKKFLPFLVQMIAKFRNDLEMVVDRLPQEKNCVYQLAFQLYPLTKSIDKDEDLTQRLQ